MSAKMPALVGGYLAGDDALVVTPVTDRQVGIEIEVEHVAGFQLQDPATPLSKRLRVDVGGYWSCVQDNSLRNNGAEFVSFPTKISEISKAVQSLLKDTAHPTTWSASPRTGIHVHVDARDFTAENLKTLMVTYALMEPALFMFVGDTREENIFCVPWYRAQGDALQITKWLDSPKMGLPSKLENIGISVCKYSAFNMQPLSKYGTVEFRHAPTWLYTSVITEWATICERLVSAAKTMTPLESLARFDDSPDHYTRSITGIGRVYANYDKLIYATGADLLARKIVSNEISVMNPNDGWVRLAPDLEDTPASFKVGPTKKKYPWTIVEGNPVSSGAPTYHGLPLAKPPKTPKIMSNAQLATYQSQISQLYSTPAFAQAAAAQQPAQPVFHYDEVEPPYEPDLEE